MLTKLNVITNRNLQLYKFLHSGETTTQSYRSLCQLFQSGISMGAALVLVLHERLTLSDIELILFRDRPWTRVWLRGRLGLRWCVNYFYAIRWEGNDASNLRAGGNLGILGLGIGGGCGFGVGIGWGIGAGLGSKYINQNFLFKETMHSRRTKVGREKVRGGRIKISRARCLRSPTTVFSSNQLSSTMSTCRREHRVVSKGNFFTTVRFQNWNDVCAEMLFRKYSVRADCMKPALTTLCVLWSVSTPLPLH